MPTLVFHGGTVSGGVGQPDTDQLLVVDGQVAAWTDAWPADAELVDLAGGYLGPAFGDGHAHLLLAGREASGPAIRSAGSVADIVATVKDWADTHPEADWIVGASYDSALAPDGLFDARWLDAAVPDRPIVLRAWDYHTVWCNSVALQRAGISATTPDPADGIIPRRPDGSPLGTLIESGATDLVLSLVPVRSLDATVEDLRLATHQAAGHGITWVQEAWVEAGDLPAWTKAAQQGALAVDVDLALRADPTRWTTQRDELTGHRDQLTGVPGLTCQTLKFFIDGIIENHTAHLLDDYADSCTKGLPVWQPEALQAAFTDAAWLGFDLHLHAIGDAGIRSALDAIEHLRTMRPAADQRITLAHAQVVDQADLDRFAELDVTVCFQPLWAAEDAVMRDLTLPRLGPERELQYRMRSVIDTGARISFGSDWPVTSPDVLAGIRTAVTRQTTDGYPTNGWQPTERITIDEALTAATEGTAYQARAEHRRGHLVPGAQADLVWLSNDPRSIPADQLGDTAVYGTWRHGQRTT